MARRRTRKHLEMNQPLIGVDFKTVLSSTVTNIQQHGPEACYAGGSGEPYYQPVLICLCGFSTGRCDSWEDAGREYDKHRKEIGEC